MAVEGPVIEWVATHRKHHRFSDVPGDPHSPHVDHAPGWRGALRGFGHAHIGWIFRGKDKANPARYAKDLLADRDLRFISRTFPLWVAVGLAVPFALGLALTGTIAGGLTGLLWGGVVRIFLLHHATFSINSLCHCFGRRPYSTGDEARNLAWLAPIAFGRPGTTTITPFPRPPAMVWADTRSTRAVGSSADWSAATWPGTSSGSARPARKRCGLPDRRAAMSFAAGTGLNGDTSTTRRAP